MIPGPCHARVPLVRPPRGRISGLAAILILAACSGSGGGSSGGYAKSAVLLDIRFPDPAQQNTGGIQDPPDNASLIQQVIFVFSDAPDPGRVGSNTLPIRDLGGFPVMGRYDVEGPRVTFTPQLPLRVPAPNAEGGFDSGGAGLMPESAYTIRVSPSTWDFIRAVGAELVTRFQDTNDPRGIVVPLLTTADPDLFLTGLPALSPRLVGADPPDGAVGVSPQLYTDPEGLFEERRSYTLTFDRPLHPATFAPPGAPGQPGPQALEGSLYRLIDLDDQAAGHESGLPLGTDAELVVNEVDEAVVRVESSGILPFGHLLALEAPQRPRGIAQPEADRSETQVATAFATAAGRQSTIVDLLVEDFDDTARQDQDRSVIELGTIPADWDRLDSGVLQAGFGFVGAGELGQFLPPEPPDGETRTIVLDTSRQVFPLFDGSTPEAPPGYEVVGGVFPFTDITIPKGVILQARGANPLVLTATGDVSINGDVEVFGSNGNSDSSFDSAVASMPGGTAGVGGGRGGVGHPIVYWPPDQISLTSLVTPKRGGQGWGPRNEKQIGGQGGESGIKDDAPIGIDQEISCNETGSNDNGDRAAGGGGGTLLTLAEKGRSGTGNVVPNGSGGYKIRSRNNLKGGAPGTYLFALDGIDDNDFFGVTGQFREPFGGQGAGGGGSRMEAYYCGVWCKHDEDGRNDELCKGGEFGDPPQFADSVGDARGGGGGGGGGVFVVQAFGQITLLRATNIKAFGGRGGGGETLGRSNWGGPAGGGSGGAVILESAVGIEVRNSAVLDVSGGGASGGVGDGGNGIVQLQPPFGTVADMSGTVSPPESWVDQDNSRNPASFSPRSVGVSLWYDLGRVTQRPPSGTNPVFDLRGLDPDGFVITKADGGIDPSGSDIRVDYLGRRNQNGGYEQGEEPRDWFIPENATVRVEFQGADPVAPGSKEVDPATIVPSPTTWATSADVADSHQFLRWRITFDIAARPEDQLGPDSRRPVVQTIQVRSDF